MQGKELIKSYLPDMPTLPGVYRFLDAGKNILYIGKAKNLRNRVAQYSLELVGKNKTMVSLARSIEYSVTDSESSALLLESQLIKKFKPKFNILLKSDKSFPYIKLRTDHEYPQLLKFRGKNLQGGKFFGPFASSMHVDITLAELQKVFKLRSCSDNFFANRSRPCMQYQIKKCYAPCVGRISKENYRDLVQEVKAFLSGKNVLLQNMLSAKMEELSEKLEYEKAAEIRDRIKAISYVQLKSQVSHNLKDADVIALASRNGEFCVEIFLYRSGRPCGNQAYFPMHTGSDSTDSEVLGNFIIQVYQDKIPPSELLLSHEIEDAHIYVEAFKKLHNVKVKISVPKTGGKSKIIENAVYNARLALEKQLKTSAKNLVLLKEIQKLFNLAEIPKRIEIYDNSHIQGAFPVGAMVVAGREGFEKKEYRLFNIKDEETKTLIGGDDYAMLREVLTRRFKRLKTEPDRVPDLLIIDGGKGHLGVVKKLMQETEVDIPFVCMAKGVDRNSGREQFHTLDNVFTLDKNMPVMKYLQILRDEVHNFAIKSHRKKRSAAIKVSTLDSIPGIGNVRKRALLNYFGSFAAISDATELELAKVKGISRELAKTLHKNLRNYF